ncbi:MAG: hypothetical protein ACRDP4_00370, partial [Nocardioidaceae bacterium]
MVFAGAGVWLFLDRDSGGDVNASTRKVELPDKLGDLHASKNPEDDVLIDKTRKDYKNVLGAAVDFRAYTSGSGEGDTGGDGDETRVSVQAVRADLPFSVYASSEDWKYTYTKVRDDMWCASLTSEDYE